MSPPEQRRGWAYRFTSRCPQPPPKYGSAEWLALPDDDPAKVAAVVVAAERWRYDEDHWQDDLRREVELMAAAFKAEEDRAYVERRDAHRAEWKGGQFRGRDAVAADVEDEFRRWVDGEAA